MVIFVVGSFPGTEMSIETFFLFEPNEFLDSIVINSTDTFFLLSFKNNHGIRFLFTNKEHENYEIYSEKCEIRDKWYQLIQNA